MAGGGERRSGRDKAERVRGGKGGGHRSGVKARSSAPRRPKRVATAAADAAGAAAGVRQTEADPSATRTSERAEVESAQPTTPAGVRWSSTPSGVRLSLDTLTVEALQAVVEKGELKAVVSVRRGDELLYSERVNFDWPGGREKFLRKSARALATAGVATRVTAALLAEMRAALRTPTRKPPSDPASVSERATARKQGPGEGCEQT